MKKSKAKPNPLRKWRWFDKIYYAEYILLYGPADSARDWVVANITQQAADQPFMAGKMLYLVKNNQTIVVIWINPDENQSVLVHECFHAAATVLMNRGLALSDQSEEAFAYYLGWVYRSCTDRLNDK